jgi:hypothetical protein
VDSQDRVYRVKISDRSLRKNPGKSANNGGRGARTLHVLSVARVEGVRSFLRAAAFTEMAD